MIATYSCRNEFDNHLGGEKGVDKVDVYIDTILEENYPSNLDLTNHQLFIDTSRTSEFYEIIRTWRIDKYAEEAIESYLNDYKNSSSDPHKYKMNGYPTKLIKIRKRGGDFLLYERSDGVDPRYELRDSVIILYGVHEPQVATIESLKKHSKDRIEVNIVMPFSSEVASSNVGLLIIERTVQQNIYKLSVESELINLEDYVISKDDVYDFDLLVNHSPLVKVLEYDDFEEIDLKLIESKHNTTTSSQHLKTDFSGSRIYEFDISFAEWGGKSLGNKVKVSIKGERIQITFLQGNISGLKKGDVIDEGLLLKHKSGEWIISTDRSAVTLDEIGGCTGGPAVIDFENKKYIVC